MRAVTGSVASSKRVSVSKAAAILSRFAAAETGARRDVAAYLKRASAAFDELVRFHREVRDGQRRRERGSRVEEKETRRKKHAGSDGDPNPREVEGNPRGRPEKEIRGIREVEEEKEVLEGGDDGNLTEVEGNYGGGVAREEDGKRNSKKKGVNDARESSELGGRNEKKMEVEGERRKEEKKRRREMGEERRDGGGKKRRNSDDGEENEGGGLDDQSERHKKKKKRRKIGTEE
ncbi:DNA topoisomerase 1-like [Phoenix dactylifera]|uniref:DNA topoisomerase 1-like n=1 Tax=Phoenix dactylifera TaxID=42345 RepID=A0A8B7MU46_PHODC|nr:DNA topoisomerase 1-like [Phoenix dactylifera]XP_026660598.1 DNA topoisomerase 1-like [Phoenix dactylifera]